ncbi:MAG: tetratricopeptide repeat protein, partial [Mesorhizobium sp.]
LVSVLSVPLIAWGLYSTICAAGRPGEPLYARLSADPATSSVEELLARAERHLADNPDDARGWSVIAPVYLRQERYGDARTAFENAIRLLGSDAGRQVGLGEAIAGIAGGIVTADARTAFERALAIDPAEPRARYFLATALIQEGRLEEAQAALAALKSSLPADSPWQVAIDAAQRGAAERAHVERQVADTAEATKDMSAEERQSMIEGMVASLDAKLRAEPGDVEGWERLIRSYVVLGRRDAAEEALTRARSGLAGNAAALDNVNRFAADLGIGKGG